MSESHCPFCNCVLPALAAAPASEKRPCPRCGEPVPAGRWPIDPALATALQTGTAPLPPTPGRADPGAANRKTGLIMVGIMIAMAFIGLGYMLWTVKARRARDPKKVEKLEPIAVRRPLELSGLGYVPKDCQIVAGLHIAELINDKKAGKALLAEPRPVLLDWPLRQIGHTTGLKPEDLDHIILATELDPRSLQLVMIVKTRAKVSLEKIADAHPKKSSLHLDQPLYEFTIDPLGAALLWCVDDLTLIYVIRLDDAKVEHLHNLSVTPRKLDQALPEMLQKTLKERLPTHPLMWSVGQLDQLGAAKDWLPLALGARADIAPLREVQTFALAVEPIEGMTLQGEFRLPNAKSAAAFKAFLEAAKIEGARSQKVEAAPVDAPEQWVSWQVRGDVATVREQLNRGKELKK